MPTRTSAIERWRSFAAAWVANGFRGMDAARTAGYRGSNAVLKVRACKLLAKPEVQDILAEQGRRAGTSAEEALAVLAAQMRGDMGDFLDVADDGSARVNLSKANELGVLALIRRFRQRTVARKGGGSTTTIEIELCDAQTAAIAVGKATGLFSEAEKRAAPNFAVQVVVKDYADLDDEEPPSAPELPNGSWAENEL